MAKLLIVTPEEKLGEDLKRWFTREMSVVDSAVNGAAGLERLLFTQYDLCILDWRAPLLSVLEVLSQYRAAGGTARIIVLAGRELEHSRIRALDAGADDCVVEPWSLPELSARVRALLRRPASLTNDIYHFDKFVFDCRSKSLTREDQEVRLRPKEYQLLEFLLRHNNQFFKAETLLKRVWSSSSRLSDETVRTHVKTLRRKLDTPGSPSIIKTSPGLGYKISVSNLNGASTAIEADSEVTCLERQLEADHVRIG